MPPTSAAVDAVCWDWNGTLLDDLDVARAAMNVVLEEHQLPPVPDRDSYRAVFGFPIHAFYARLGIGDADFRPAATRYLELFAAQISLARLQPGAMTALSDIQRSGVEQVLISATIDETLRIQMAPHDVDQHFAHILGITDFYAASKADVVAHWLTTSGHDPGRVLMIGDTNHDEEIADDLQVRFIRFARGHQQPPTHDRHPVVHHLEDVLEHLRGHRNARDSLNAQGAV